MLEEIKFCQFNLFLLKDKTFLIKTQLMKRNFSEWMIDKSFNFSVQIIQRFCDMELQEQQVEKLRMLPEGTLGKEIANCLDARSLKLVPKFESHDLKHILLNYDMSPLEEIRMQAFMLGNGNWTLVSVVIFIYGLLLFPTKWRLFLEDIQKGKRSLKIAEWTIESYAACNIFELRSSVFEGQIATRQGINWTVQISLFGSYTLIAAGVFGMLFCFPFLWSSNIADLVGAGFPFVAGAILLVGGLLNLSILSNKMILAKT